MTSASGTTLRYAPYLIAMMIGVAAQPASAQLFSTRDGYAPDGSYRVHVEVTSYLWLPALNATLGLKRPAGTDVSINRPRLTVSKIANSLNGAFVADSLVRFGPWSAELNVDWISAHQSKTFPALVNAPEAKLKVSDSVVYVSPGVGYQFVPGFAPDKLSFDLRAGFSYFETSASASFAQSRFGGAEVSYSFVQPWLGFRADYYPSPRWRIELAAAVTGLGVDNGVWGWNARLGPQLSCRTRRQIAEAERDRVRTGRRRRLSLLIALSRRS
jgi:hypothetical protein